MFKIPLKALLLPNNFLYMQATHLPGYPVFLFVNTDQVGGLLEIRGIERCRC